MSHRKTTKLILFGVLGMFFSLAAGLPSYTHAQVYMLDPSTGYLKPVSQAQFQYQGSSQQLQLQQLLLLIAQLERLIEQLGGDKILPGSGPAEIDITTRPATAIDEDSARLSGRIDFNDSDYAYVWFEWGEDEDDLDEETPHIRVDDDDDEDFSAGITRLEEGDRYYFRAIGEDDRGRVDRGSVRSFRADEDRDDDDDREDEPEVEVEEAEDVTDDSAELSAEVDMNDFDDGRVFLVYGEDEDQVSDVEDNYDSYNDIDEDGDNLQKILVDSSLDGRSSYTVDIEGLDDDTEYSFTFCVEYENEDNDETLVCGSVEEFETD